MRKGVGEMKVKWLVVVGAVVIGVLSASSCAGGSVEPVDAVSNEPRARSLSVELREGETYEVELDQEPDGACEWEAAFGEAYLELVGLTSDEATGHDTFTFLAVHNGVTEATFSCSRPDEVFVYFTIGADPALADALSEAEAREIAVGSECGEAGALLANAVYNDWTATWWIDLDAEKEGCSPACVVEVRTGEAEINWRCTGALPPADD
jgi:hypothetical protein